MNGVTELVGAGVELRVTGDGAGGRGDLHVGRAQSSLIEQNVRRCRIDRLSVDRTMSDGDGAGTAKTALRPTQMQSSAHGPGDRQRSQIEEGHDVGDRKVARGDVEIELGVPLPGKPGHRAVQSKVAARLMNSQSGESGLSLVGRAGDDHAAGRLAIDSQLETDCGHGAIDRIVDRIESEVEPRRRTSVGKVQHATHGHAAIPVAEDRSLKVQGIARSLVLEVDVRVAEQHVVVLRTAAGDPRDDLRSFDAASNTPGDLARAAEPEQLIGLLPRRAREVVADPIELGEVAAANVQQQIGPGVFDPELASEVNFRVRGGQIGGAERDRSVVEREVRRATQSDRILRIGKDAGSSRKRGLAFAATGKDPVLFPVIAQTSGSAAAQTGIANPPVGEQLLQGDAAIAQVHGHRKRLRVMR